MNKIRSTIGGLAMLASTAIGGESNQVARAVGTNDVARATIAIPKAKFTYIGFLPSGTNRVNLKGIVSAYDSNHYKVQFRDSLTTGSWTDSVQNTDIYCEFPMFGDLQFDVAEPLVSSNRFYRLKSTSLNPQ